MTSTNVFVSKWFLICWRMTQFIQSCSCHWWFLSGKCRLSSPTSPLQQTGEKGASTVNANPSSFVLHLLIQIPQKTDAARGEGEPGVTHLWSCGCFSNFEIWRVWVLLFPDVREGEKVTDSRKTKCRRCRCCAILRRPAEKSIPSSREPQFIDASPQTTSK